MNRILVVMPNWFGEALFTTPFLAALRAARPDASVTALGVSRCHEVLAHNPNLQELILYEEQGLLRSLRAKARLIAELRSRRFDTAFILRRSLSRTVLLVLSGIPKRIGFANAKSGWLLTHRVQAPSVPTHKAQVSLRLLEPFGIDDHRASYQYYLTEEEREHARGLLRSHGVSDGKPTVVLHPGANWAHKRWSPERFAELATRLIQHQPLSLVVTGGPDDQPLVQTMLNRMTGRPIVLAGQTRLRQLAACLEHASLIVANDTGILHIATALGRPVVALYGPTSPAITGPLGNPDRMIVIHHPDCCPAIPCVRPRHPGYPGMESISVDEVYDAAITIMDQTKR